MATPAQGIPPNDGVFPVYWYSFFIYLWKQAGQATGVIPVSGANFSPTAPNQIFAGPAAGALNNPSFRSLVSADLVPVAGEFPGVTGASPIPSGDVGEYASFASAPVAMTSTGTFDVVVLPNLAPGNWDVWGSFGIVPAGGASWTQITAWLNTVSATDPSAPNGGAYLSRGVSAGETLGQFEPVGAMQLLVPTATPVYLSASVTFTGGTMGGYGFIGARRRA